MSLLDSFFIQFTSNAKDVKKDTADAKKATDDFQQQINKTDQSVALLGQSFSKLALAGVEALVAFTSLGKLKDAIIGAVDFNAAIEKTARITNTNSRELAIWNGVVARAGGDPNSKEYLNFITKLNQQYAGFGINQRIKYVSRDLVELSAKFQTLGHDAAYALSQKLGIGDDLFLALEKGPAALQEMINKQNELNNITEETTKASFELEQQWADTKTEFRSAFTSLIPFAEVFLSLLQGIAQAVRIIADLFTLSGWKDLSKTGTFRAVTDLFTINGWKDLAAGLPARNAQGVTSPVSVGEQESRAFWKSRGFTDAQISGLLANESAESNFNPNAVGDNGSARGSFQWHADRRAKILAATGIDVTTAGHQDQLRAAAWELENRGDADRLRATTDPAQAAGVVSQYFERPAGGAGEAYKRGQWAGADYARMQQMMAAGQTSVAQADGTPVIGGSAGGNKSLTIGSITINNPKDSQEVANNLTQTLNEHFATTIGAYDDGVLY